MDDSKSQSIVAKLVGAGTALAAAFVVRKIIAQAWQAKTGRKPPEADDPGDAGLAEIVAAAAITGALVSMARVLATRGTAKFATKSD